MRWSKRGLIYCPDGKGSWAERYALQPTPLLRGDTIRVYVGLRDRNGVSRVGFVDVAADNPSQVIAVSEQPVLDIGEPGTFDENGVVPCAIVAREGRLYLYYAGYQLGQRVRFYVFGGLAVSDDGGNSFVRYSRVPVVDRTDDELFFRVIHSLILEAGTWRIWYGGGSRFIPGAAKTYPVYDVRYMESRDGLHFPSSGVVCIGTRGEDEHRLGRPYVLRDGKIYRMFYGVGTQSKGYRLGYAESVDGYEWVRKDEEIGIDVSENGWDSQMIGYPALVRHAGRTCMFYTGNNMGETGFGYAVLEEW